MVNNLSVSSSYDIKKLCLWEKSAHVKHTMGFSSFIVVNSNLKCQKEITFYIT